MNWQALKFEPTHVVGEAFGVRIEPLRLEHAEELNRLMGVTDFRYYSERPEPMDLDGWRRFIENRNASNSFGHSIWQGEELVGMSTLFDISAANRKLEIGYTMIRPDRRGGIINPASKLILMATCFETWGAVRVQLKGDARNAPSMRAMLRMGFSLEGTLNKFQLLDGGSYERDVTFYSVTHNDWGRVKAHLTALIEARRQSQA